MKKNVVVAFVMILAVFAAAYFYFKNSNSQEIASQKISEKVAEEKTVQAVAEKPVAESMKESLSEKYGKSTDVVSVEAAEESGGFAHGTVRFEDELSGGLWFAAKTDEGWQLVFDGNGIVPCDAIEGYAFPKEIIPSCIDTQNGNELVQR